MDILSIIFIAIGLSMDALAVSITIGCSEKSMKWYHPLKVGGFFGGFQAIMPILGYFLGIWFVKYIEKFDHWLAFGILLIIGIKMIYESFKLEEFNRKECLTETKTLSLLAVATSIDAFAVGLSITLLYGTIFYPALLIGIITFIITLLGVYVGKFIGNITGNKIELIGGVILIIIGIRIVIQHIFFK